MIPRRAVGASNDWVILTLSFAFLSFAVCPSFFSYPPFFVLFGDEITYFWFRCLLQQVEVIKTPYISYFSSSFSFISTFLSFFSLSVLCLLGKYCSCMPFKSCSTKFYTFVSPSYLFVSPLVLSPPFLPLRLFLTLDSVNEQSIPSLTPSPPSLKNKKETSVPLSL